MSNASLCMPDSRFGLLGQITVAVSGYTQSSRRRLDEPVKAHTPSAMEQARFEWPASALLEVFAEATDEAAQNPEQSAPTSVALEEAICLLKMLPIGIDSPEPVVEPSGTIAWLWDRGDQGFLVLAVDGTGRLQRSAVIDGQEIADGFPLSSRLPADAMRSLAHFRSTHG